MNTLSGYTEVDLVGQMIPFKFGTNAWALFCEMRKIEFGKIVESGVFNNDFIALRDLFYCAHQAACRTKGEQTKVNLYEFGDLLDETKGVMTKLEEVMLQSKILGYTLSELAEEGKPKENF